ncbi:uncharacterized protein BXZ73DRAFT_108403 [Epithele typhae]|uniref:uncharacterized protein n=1 Tax=Epithele typhae TaxID=378194 RepID=UPI00200805F6|nr:uncharacterized protein BXZ73DRAFT_108403 [Epithele typhae]KAH9910884.1 hypothetical protein BXZ73DRAFT_108403 [Epithele typhae]
MVSIAHHCIAEGQKTDTHQQAIKQDSSPDPIIRPRPPIVWQPTVTPESFSPTSYFSDSDSEDDGENEDEGPDTVMDDNGLGSSYGGVTTAAPSDGTPTFNVTVQLPFACPHHGVPLHPTVSVQPIPEPPHPAVEPDVQQLPLLIPLPMAPDVDRTVAFTLRSHGAPGLRLADLFQDADDHADLRSCLDRAPVDRAAVFAHVDAAEYCVCQHLPGGRVRVADPGFMWPVWRVRLGDKGFARPGACWLFGDLVHAVVTALVEWWAHEEWQRKRAACAGDARIGRILGPGSITLENVYVLALRRRLVGPGDFEWMPEIEVRL